MNGWADAYIDKLKKGETVDRVLAGLVSTSNKRECMTYLTDKEILQSLVSKADTFLSEIQSLTEQKSNSGTTLSFQFDLFRRLLKAASELGWWKSSEKEMHFCKFFYIKGKNGDLNISLREW